MIYKKLNSYARHCFHLCYTVKNFFCFVTKHFYCRRQTENSNNEKEILRNVDKRRDVVIP